MEWLSILRRFTRRYRDHCPDRALRSVARPPKLAGRLEELLDLQTPEGNWIHTAPALEAGEAATRVQFCHGAPGYIFALRALRPYYPQFQGRFDQAIDKGREVTWTKGILKKEPSLCHGLFGNAL